MTSPRLSQTPSRGIRIALWTGALVIAFSMVSYTMDARLIVPFWDEWDFLAWYCDASRGEITFAGLWALVAGHRMLIPRLLFHARDTWFGGDPLVLVFSSLLLQAGVIGVIVGALLHEPRLKGTILQIGLIATSIALLTWTVQLQNFHWSLQINYVLVGFLSVAAIALMAAQPPNSGFDYPAVVATILAALACLCMGGGLAAWPALLVVAIAQRRSPLVVVLIGGGAALSATWYLGNAGALVASSHLPSPMDAVVFICRYLGPPYIRESYAIAIGAALAALAGVAIAAALARGLWGHLSGLGVGLLTFGVSAAVLTAVARFHDGIAYGRYSMFSLLFWVGILLLVGMIATMSARPIRWALVAIIAAGFVRFPLATHAVAAQPFIDLADHATVAAISLVVGTPDEDAIRAHLYPRPQLPIRLTPFLRERGYGFFGNPPVRSLGRPAAASFRIISDTCPADVEVAAWSGGLRLSGTFTSPAVSTWLILVDDTGLVRGLAATSGGSSRFAGYAGPAVATGAVLYGVRRNTLCRAAVIPIRATILTHQRRYAAGRATP